MKFSDILLIKIKSPTVKLSENSVVTKLFYKLNKF